jgi:hypothetical protein
MTDLHVYVDDLELAAEWTGDNPETRAGIEAELPIEGHATRWSDELHFRTPVDVPGENGQDVVADARERGGGTAGGLVGERRGDAG